MFDYIYHPDSTDQETLENYVKSLSVLRLCGAQFYLGGVTFSNRLVELELRGLGLGYDSTLANHIAALSTPPELRDLRFISVTTFADPWVSRSMGAFSKTSLPKLKTLLVHDLYSNTRDVVLISTVSRSHRLTLHFTAKTFQVLYAGEPEPNEAVPDDVIRLSPTSRSTPSMPDLEILKMIYWECDDPFCGYMGHRGGNWPRIKNMYFSWARIRDENAFKRMVRSYSDSLERMELGAAIIDAEDSVDWGPLDDDDELVTWLETNVQGFELVDEDYIPPEFQRLTWQLW